MNLKAPEHQGFTEWLERDRQIEIGTGTRPTTHQGQTCWDLGMMAIAVLRSAEQGVGHGD